MIYEVIWVQGLDGALGANRHEDWGLDDSVGCGEFTAARLGFVVGLGKFEHF